MIRKIWFYSCVLLTGFSAYICVQIEIYNWQAGGVLPRGPNEGGYTQKWRNTAGWIIEKHMIQQYENEARPAGRVFVLTAEQKAEIEQKKEEERRDSRLHGFVASFGLAQYVVGPAALIFSGIVVLWNAGNKRMGIAGCVMGLISLVCIGTMFYRSYSGSLGW